MMETEIRTTQIKPQVRMGRLYQRGDSPVGAGFHPGPACVNRRAGTEPRPYKGAFPEVSLVRQSYFAVATSLVSRITDVRIFNYVAGEESQGSTPNTGGGGYGGF